MAVVLLLGFAGDRFGPFGSTILVIAVLSLFAVIGLLSGTANWRTPSSIVTLESQRSWTNEATLASSNWLELVIDHQEMTRHISLEIDRSRRFDRTFTVVVIAPDLNALSENGVEPSSESELNTLRLFAQEVAVRQLRTTDVISNSVMPAATIVLLPETDSDGTNIALARIRDALESSKMTIGLGGQTELKISVMAVNYPDDVRDTMGFIESIKEFEDRVSSALPST